MAVSHEMVSPQREGDNAYPLLEDVGDRELAEDFESSIQQFQEALQAGTVTEVALFTLSPHDDQFAKERAKRVGEKVMGDHGKQNFYFETGEPGLRTRIYPTEGMHFIEEVKFTDFPVNGTTTWFVGQRNLSEAFAYLKELVSFTEEITTDGKIDPTEVTITHGTVFDSKEHVAEIAAELREVATPSIFASLH